MINEEIPGGGAAVGVSVGVERAGATASFGRR